MTLHPPTTIAFAVWRKDGWRRRLCNDGPVSNGRTPAMFIFRVDRHGAGAPRAEDENPLCHVRTPTPRWASGKT